MKAIVAAVLLVAACGDDGGSMPDARPVDALPPDAAPTEVIMESRGLELLESAELIMTAGPGDIAVITLSAPEEIGWNIHGHAGGGTQIVDEGRGIKMLDRYVFAPTAAADWYLLIRNESAGGANQSVDIKVELYGDIPWRWQ